MPDPGFFFSKQNVLVLSIADIVCSMLLLEQISFCIIILQFRVILWWEKKSQLVTSSNKIERVLIERQKKIIELILWILLKQTLSDRFILSSEYFTISNILGNKWTIFWGLTSTSYLEIFHCMMKGWKDTIAYKCNWL